MKKLLCVLLALAACCLLATAAVAANAATVPTTCAAGCENPQWEPIPSKWYLLDEGHYHFYLTGNDKTYRYTPNPSGTVSSTNSGNKVTICLDLNGYNISTNGRSLGVYYDCTLNIMDSSAEQTGYVQGGHGTNNLVGGTVFNYGTVNLYSGTLRYSNTGTAANATYAGGVMSMDKTDKATFNMHGGKLEGGALIASSSNGNSYGGTIYAVMGNINLYAGEITSGSVPEGKNGPGIYLVSSAKITLSGDAKVENIFVNGSSVKVNIDGTYSGKARITYGSSISLSNGKVIGTATNTPNITGDLFCTNGNGWLVNVSGGNLQLETFTPSGERHYCEHCKEVVKWTAMTSSNYNVPTTQSGTYHYYLTGKLAKYVISGGSSATDIRSTLCLDLYGQTIQPSSGRALLVYGGSTLNLMDSVGGGQVIGSKGSSNPTGGTITVSTNGLFNMYGGTMKFAYSEDCTTYKGGVVYVSGNMNMYGGRIEGVQLNDHATNPEEGAAISLNTAASSLYISGGEITDGILPTSGKGSCIHMQSGTLTLTGDPTIANIYTTSKTTLTVSGDFTGTASVTYSTAPALGEEVGISDNARILGTLTCTNGDRLIKSEGEKLIVAINAPVVIVNGETETGYETLAAAIKDFESGYIKLLKPLTGDVTVSKDITLDLNGYSITGTVTVEEGAILYGMDKETDDYTVEDEVYGTLTAAGKGQVAAQEGYLRVNEDGKLSFHRVTVSIDTMTLRPSVAGLYYKSTFLGDEVVARAVERFGVALSVYDIPDENNMESLCQASKFTEFQPGENGNATSSTLLKNILKTTNISLINRRNLNMGVYGRPYLKTADGYVFGQYVTRDLAKQMKDVNTMMDTLSGTQQNAVVEMYETYKSLLSELSLNKIEDEINNDTLRILMVGNSFCYYYVEELYGLLMANPNREYSAVEIYNVYYSGCKLDQHYNWWKAGEAKYELWKTDVNGRNKQTPAVGTAWSLEDALQQGRWDYISLQGASTEVDYVTQETESICAAIIPYTEPLLDRFHALYPKAQLLWHRTWAFEVGRISNGITYTEESLAAYDAGMQAACDYMCNEFDKDKDYDLIMVNSGAAWPIARAENARLAESLLPDGGLCARKNVRNEGTFPLFPGNSNAGDGYHDGDIGGGQFLNACVWYETITGQSVLENTYKPTGAYTLSDALVALLRNAAHTALNKE